MNKSFIISYREDSEDRKYNLRVLLNWLANVQDGYTEIILVEQDSVPKINWLEEIRGKEFIKYHFIKNDGVFNLGWGYNIGGLIADSNVLIFNSVDILVRPATLNTSVSELMRFDIIKPYKTIISLNKKDTITFIGNNCVLPPNNIHELAIDKLISSGVFVMKKEMFIMLKGFDEDCYGYGYDDNIFDEKIKKLELTTSILNDTAIHLHHKNKDDNNDIYYYFTESNKQLFNDYELLDKDGIIDKINSIKKWGDVDVSKSNDISVRHLKRELFEQVSNEIITSLSNKFTDDYINELVDTVSASIYNTIIIQVKEKITNDFKDIKFTESKKKSLIKRIMDNFRL